MTSPTQSQARELVAKLRNIILPAAIIYKNTQIEIAVAVAEKALTHAFNAGCKEGLGTSASLADDLHNRWSAANGFHNFAVAAKQIGDAIRSLISDETGGVK